MNHFGLKKKHINLLLFKRLIALFGLTIFVGLTLNVIFKKEST